MKFSACQIANLLKGEVDGNPDVMVSRVSKIEEGESGTITFLANEKFTKYIYTTKASVVLINRSFVPEKNIKSTLIKVDDPYKSIAHLLEIYNKCIDKPSGIEKNSYIDKSVKKGKNIYVGTFAYIGKNVVIGDNTLIFPGTFIGNNVNIGSNTIIYPSVNIYEDCTIGNNCIIHAGSVIGSDGFGFAPNENKEFVKIAQIGNVIIEDNVEIGALVTIDRATMGSTIIRKGVKLDNHNHVAHNVEIGENTVIAAQTGIAGTAKIGKNCMIGGQVGISPHVKIADNTKIASQSGITKSILKKNTIIMGSPAFDMKDFHKSYIHFKALDKINKRLEKLEKNRTKK